MSLPYAFVVIRFVDALIASSDYSYFYSLMVREAGKGLLLDREEGRGGAESKGGDEPRRAAAGGGDGGEKK